MNAPLLLLHGFAGSPETFAGLFEGSEPLRMAPYLTGHGAGPAVGWAQSFDDEVARLARLVGQELAKPVHVVGYSLGARLGLGLVVHFAELVDRATLIGVNPGLRTEVERRSRRALDGRFAEILESDGIERFVSTWEALPLFESQKRLGSALVERQRRVRLGHSAHGLAHAMRTLGLAEMPDFWPFLPAIDRPVTLVVGAEDEKFKNIAREMHALVPRASLVIAPACGHNVMLEAPDLVGGLLGTRSEIS